LRRERFVAYQVAMLVGMAAQSAGMYSLMKYEHHQTHIEKASNFAAGVHNDDIVAAEILTCIFCAIISTFLSVDFFALLFWPTRVYPKWYIVTRKSLAAGLTAGMLAAAIMSSFVIARHSEFITGVSPQVEQELVNLYFRPPLEYKKWPVNLAYLVLLWIATIASIASTVLMFMADRHDERYGFESSDTDSDTVDETTLANEKTLATEKTLPV